MNRADFQDLADLRIAESRLLYQQGMFDGSYYLAGYAIEAGLKACIARLTNSDDFPPRNTQRDYYTHDFEVLLKTAALDTIFSIDRKANQLLDDNWKIVRLWKEDSRYEKRGSKSRSDADQFLQSITNLPDGVLTWIKQRW